MPDTDPSPRSSGGAHARFADSLDALRRRVAAFRIREHLRRTEADLRASAHDDHTPKQRRRRRRAVDRLAAYRRRGEFPTNRTEADRTPLFVGDDGTPCAMAALLLADGRDDLVESVVDGDRTVRIEALPEDHPVVEWTEENGLTQAEAARVQPTYPEGVQFATTCGSLPCWAAGALASTVGLAAFAAAEYVGYRVAADAFPDNALKRRGLLGYVTVMNLFLAPFLALLLFALFP